MATELVADALICMRLNADVTFLSSSSGIHWLATQVGAVHDGQRCMDWVEIVYVNANIAD